MTYYLKAIEADEENGTAKIILLDEDDDKHVLEMSIQEAAVLRVGENYTLVLREVGREPY